MVIWFISLILTSISLDKVVTSSSIPSIPSANDSSSHQLHQNDDIAIDIPGIELQLSPPNNNDNDVPIQVIYTNYTTTLYKPSKGIVLLLHAHILHSNSSLHHQIANHVLDCQRNYV